MGIKTKLPRILGSPLKSKISLFDMLMELEPHHLNVLTFWEAPLEASSTSRVLTRGASEGCLHQASAQALPLGIGTNSAFSKVPTEDGTGQGEGESAAFQGSPKHPPNAVLENSVLESQRVWGGSDSRRKKGGKFRPRTSESFLRRVGSEQDPLGRRFATYRNRPSLRQMTISKKGGRRYSMDDYGVNIAHRAELQTSQVKISRDKKKSQLPCSATHCLLYRKTVHPQSKVF